MGYLGLIKLVLGLVSFFTGWLQRRGLIKQGRTQVAAEQAQETLETMETAHEEEQRIDNLSNDAVFDELQSFRRNPSDNS